MNERPFVHCLIHGLIRDKEGRKMSKSLGNGIDPMDMCELYGADSLRYYLVCAASNGTDIRFDEEKIKATWNFINKLWNASRFVLLNIEDLKQENYTLQNLKKEDKWILTRLNKTIKTVTKYMEKYEFNNAGAVIYDFIWTDFCDKYIELAKFSLDDYNTKSVLLKTIDAILKMLHPFMPYVTDEVYNMLPIKEETIMLSSYPVYEKEYVFVKEEKEIDELLDFVREFRNIKAENNIGKDYYVKWDNDQDYTLAKKMLKVQDNVITEEMNIQAYKVKTANFEATIYYEKVLTEKDIAERNKEIEKLKSSIERRQKLLANENYVAKAPANLVSEERQKLKEEEEKLASLRQ